MRPRCPHTGVSQAVAPLLAPLAPARRLRILELAWSRGPGMEVAPWTRAGVQEAAASAGLETIHETLEVSQGHEALDPEHGLVTTELAGTRRPRSVPARWFGDHACLVLPLASIHRGQPQARGPLEAAWSALDVMVDGPRQREDAQVAARLLGTVFASLTVVLDASWWTELADPPIAARALTSLDRCFAASTPLPDPAWAQELLRTFDPWFAQKLHLKHGRRGSTQLRATGSGASLSWPRIPPAAAVRKRKTGTRVIEALWKPPTTKAASLGPAVPGSLARIWKGWSP